MNYKYLLGQITSSNCFADHGDIAHLRSEIACHQIHVVSQFSPSALCVVDNGLTPQLSLDAHLQCDAGDLSGKSGKLHQENKEVVQLLSLVLVIHTNRNTTCLIHHRVDSILNII